MHANSGTFKTAVESEEIMKNHFINFSILAALLLSASASGQMMGMMHGGSMMGTSTVRHQFVMRNGVDPSYANKSNPLKHTPKNIEDGKRLYEQNCIVDPDFQTIN